MRRTAEDALSCNDLFVMKEENEIVAFYEAYARRCGCSALRMDTNARNTRARTLYQKLGYEETGIVKCTFNGISDIQLVCLEKGLDQ